MHAATPLGREDGAAAGRDFLGRAMADSEEANQQESGSGAGSVGVGQVRAPCRLDDNYGMAFRAERIQLMISGHKERMKLLELSWSETRWFPGDIRRRAVSRDAEASRQKRSIPGAALACADCRSLVGRGKPPDWSGFIT